MGINSLLTGTATAEGMAAMMKRAVLGTLVALALLGLLYVWFIERPPEVVAQKHEDASEAAVAVATPDRLMPSPEEPAPSTTTAVQPAPLPAKTPELPLEDSGEETIRNATKPDGTYIKVPSVALRTYYFLMGLGGDGGIPAGVQHEFGLTDDELKQLVEYSKSALQSDTQYQSNLKAAICANRNAYQTIEQFGAATNEYMLKADTHQESLGRNARSHLGTVLFSKIDAGIRRRGPSEQSSVDAVVFLAIRQRDLQTDLDRLCTSKH